MQTNQLSQRYRVGRYLLLATGLGAVSASVVALFTGFELAQMVVVPAMILLGGAVIFYLITLKTAVFGIPR
jgi:hypothetical protein